MSKKIAVILFNLGGPDQLSSVKKFLFNLFYDKAIIDLPNPFRFIIAKLISSRREKYAQEIYKKIGGKSPILEETLLQSQKLQEILNMDGNIEYKVFISMRYFHPYVSETLNSIENFNPQEIVLLPLYPQFSTTTTGSSFKEFFELINKRNITIPVKKICCYPAENQFIESQIQLIEEKILVSKDKNIKIIFSAHGLPIKIIENGDPYQYQIELSVKKIVEKLSIKNLDYIISYQSRVGPLKWLEPYTDDEIIKASKNNKTIIVVPIAFVSEHSETLVELDMDYKILAETNGAKEYLRVPTVRINEKFIKSLAKLVKSSNSNQNICTKDFSKCISERV